MTYPYLSLPMGGDKPAFDLNSPGVVLEIKKALIALAQRGSDPMSNSDPIVEDAWKHIVTTGDYANAWDGPTADEFVFMLSRYKDSLSGPWVQSSDPAIGIVGGPQPLARGLEVLAGAVQEVLGGYPKMDKYMAWRDSWFDPPSSWAIDGSEQVVFCRSHGKPLDILGYTPIQATAFDAAIASGQSYDALLMKAWALAMEQPNEQARGLAWSEIKTARALHASVALVANSPDCGKDATWNPSRMACEKKPVPFTPPPGSSNSSSSASATLPIVAVLLLGGIGAVAIWSYRTGNSVTDLFKK